MTRQRVTCADLARIYQERIAMVRRRARQLGLCEYAAEDVAQDVFVKFLKYLQNEPDVENVAGLLYRMATQSAVERLQEGKRTVCMSRESADDGGAVLRDQHLDVLRVLERVREEDALVACYYFVDGHSQERIAAELGMSRRTVERRLDSFTACAQKLVRGEIHEEDVIYRN